jgi:stage 0 sporulation regulatory protein
MKNEILKKELLANIDSKRKEMIEFAKIVGFTSEKTVKCSQELDMFLNEYQLIFLKKTS